MPLHKNSPPFSFGRNVISAALCKPPALGRKGREFLPLVCLLCWENDGVIGTPSPPYLILKVESLSQESYENSGSVSRGVLLAQTQVHVEEEALRTDHPEPSLAMGTTPRAFLLCHEDVIIVILRKQGLIYAYTFDSGELTLIGQTNVGQYVVDATVGAGELKGEIELVLLLCNPLNTRDGRIAVCLLSRFGCVL